MAEHWLAVTSCLRLQQARDRHPERLRDLFQRKNGRVANASFHPTDIGAMQPALEGKFFLREPARLPGLFEVNTDSSPHVHGAIGAEMLTFNLQTISLISLDLLPKASNHRPLSTTWHNDPPSRNMTDPSHSLESSLREKVLEHLFVGDLLRCLWCRGSRDIEVLQTEVDRGGYDLVLESNGFLRHVQLKASYRSAKTSRVGININLAKKPSGCVIWHCQVN